MPKSSSYASRRGIATNTAKVTRASAVGGGARKGPPPTSKPKKVNHKGALMHAKKKVARMSDTDEDGSGSSSTDSTSSYSSSPSDDDDDDVEEGGGEGSDDSSDDEANSPSSSSNPYGVIVVANVPLVKAFRDLAFYEGRSGNKWGRIANFKVARALTYYPSAVTSGKEVKHLAGIGKNSVARIDEFILSSDAALGGGGGGGGTMKALEAFKATYGSSYTPPCWSRRAALTPRAPPAAVVEKIEAAKVEFAKLHVGELKRLLKANSQSTTGLKESLVQRVAEGYVLGAIPNCPKCYGGRPRYNISTGIYTCPGYMDDDTFVNCYFKATDTEADGGGGIVRRGWRNDVAAEVSSKQNQNDAVSTTKSSLSTFCVTNLPQPQQGAVDSSLLPSWVIGFIEYFRYKLKKWF